MELLTQGFIQLWLPLSGHPAIKAVSPQAPVTEWFKGDDFHHNGVFMLCDAFNFMQNLVNPALNLQQLVLLILSITPTIFINII